MTNGVSTDRYKERFEEEMKDFIDENFIKTEKIILSNQYKLIINTYKGSNNIAQCFLFDNFDNQIITWHSICTDGDFYKLIFHKDKKEYLIFRQDLYGYSVLDIKNKNIMQFFPKICLEGEESFIWTNVDYNEKNNILAVEGCYWGYPCSVQLFTFDNPMNETQVFIDLLEYIDVSNIESLESPEWNDLDLRIETFLIETTTTEYDYMTIEYEKYMAWISKIETPQNIEGKYTENIQD